MKKISGLIGIVLLLLLSLTQSCTPNQESDFSILGEWDVTLVYNNMYEYFGTITFTGYESFGGVSCTVQLDGDKETFTSTGEYEVSGITISIILYWNEEEYTETLTGTIINDNLISGDILTNSGFLKGTWSCTR